MANNIFKPGDVVEFTEFWGGYFVVLRGIVQEATSYRLSIQSSAGLSIGYVFEWIDPRTVRPFIR